MAKNFFDQFDEAQTPSQGSNFFDQFDEKPTAYNPAKDSQAASEAYVEPELTDIQKANKLNRGVADEYLRLKEINPGASPDSLSRLATERYLNPQKRPMTVAEADADQKAAAARVAIRNAPVPDMTLGGIAQDTFAGAAKILPTAIKGVTDIASMATGGAVGRDASKAIESYMGDLDKYISSDRAKIQKSKFDLDISDGSVSISDAILNNKGALADQILPQIGSMFIPAGAAGTAGKLATAGKYAKALDEAQKLARIGKAEEAAVITATVLQNASDTFNTVLDKGGSLGDAYLAAGITAPFSAIAGKLTGGGAEMAFAKRLFDGRMAGGKGVLGAVSAIGKEAGQEMGEQAGQSIGESVGTHEELTANKFGKDLAVSGVLGGLMGGGVHVASMSAPQVHSFADPNGPASRAGITPIVIPNVSTPSNTGGLATGAGTGGSPVVVPSVGDMGSVDVAGRGMGGAATEIVAPSAIDPSVSQQASEPSTSVNPIKRTADSDLLSRVGTEEQSTPATIWTGRSGSGYDTVESAQQAMESRVRKDPDLDWKVEQRPDGKYHLAGYMREESAPAMNRRATDSVPESFATQEDAVAHQQRTGIADTTEVVDTSKFGGSGFAIAPQGQKETVGELRTQSAAVERLSNAVRSAGESGAGNIELATDNGSSTTPAQSRARGLVEKFGRVASAAFGIKPIAITGLNGYGAAHGGNVFVDVGAIAEDEGKRNSLVALTLGTIGHEVGHTALEKSQDPEDKKAYLNLRLAIHEHLNDGVIDKQHAKENASAAASGGSNVSREYAHNEVIQNINGAMWLDTKFWGRLYDMDNGSSMRRVAYRFMQAATKFIQAAKGSDLDINTLVKNVDAVREIVAKTWAENAMRQGKLVSRTQINKLIDTPSTDPTEDAAFKRKGVIGEVAPFPAEKKDSAIDRMSEPQLVKNIERKITEDEWNDQDEGEKKSATRDVYRKQVDRVMSDMGLRGWDVEFSSGTFEGKENPNFIITAPDTATSEQINELANAIGYVLDQKAMITFDESNTSEGYQASFVKVILPSGMSSATVKQLRNWIAKEAPAAGGDTLRDGALVYGNFSGVSDAEFESAIDAAVGEFATNAGITIDVSDVLKWQSGYIEPASREAYLEGTRYGRDSEGEVATGGDSVRSTTGNRRAWIEGVGRDAIARRQEWVDSSASGKQRAAVRRSEARQRVVESGYATEYGTPREGSTSVIGHHFSQQERRVISSALHGTGLKGAERNYTLAPENRDIQGRIYFYVDSGSGVHPEPGVGGFDHVIKLNNLYDINKDRNGYLKIAKGDSAKWERLVMKAGYDGYITDNGGHQDFAVLVGKHDIEMPSYKRRTKPVDDFVYDEDTSGDLGNFNLDSGNDLDLPDLSFADDKLAKQAELQAELDRAMGKRTVDKAKQLAGPASVTLDQMKSNGLTPEAAFSLGEMSEEGGAIDFDGADGYPEAGKMYEIREYPNGWLVGTEHSFTMGNNWTREGAIRQFRNLVTAPFIHKAGFDIASHYRKGTALKLAQTWRTLAGKQGVFKLPARSDKMDFQEVAKEVGAIKEYDIEVNGNNRKEITFTKKDGTSFNASISINSDGTFKCCTMGLEGSKIGTEFYAVASEWARNNKLSFLSDATLSAVNGFRRTEQATSYALKTGDSGVILPGVQNRVYGYNTKPATKEDHDMNIARLLIAGMRNAMEVDPNIRRLRYDPMTGWFSDSKGNDAEATVKAFLANKDARASGMGRSTLARAVMTSQILLGEFDTGAVTSFAEPVAYKRRAGLDEPLSELYAVKGDTLVRSVSATGDVAEYDGDISYSRKQLDDYMDDRRKSMKLVSPQSVLDADIDTAVKAINIAINEIKGGNREVLPIPIGRVPHVLTMLDVQPKMLRIDASIVRKVFIEKHAEEFGNITPEALVRSMYQPAMVIKAGNGDMEIVTSLVTKKGPVLIPVQPSSKTSTGKDTAAILSIYGRKLSLGGDSILQKIKDGKLVYADPVLAQVAVTGRAWGSVTPIGVNARETRYSDARPIDVQNQNVNDQNLSVKPINPYYSGWSSARDIILNGIASKKIKSDVDLIKWIGNNYKAANSPDGWEDAPAFKRKQDQALPEETKLQAFQRVMQDQYNRIKLVQDVLTESGGTVGEEQDVYRAEERMHGRVHELMRQFADKAVHPLLEKAVKYKIDLDELALYAYAKHAKERNAHIQTINGQVQTGSGMSDDEADNIIQMVELSDDAAKFEELHKDLMGMTATTRRVLVDEGLITQDQYDGLEKQYENYVPLRGFADQDEDNGKVRPGLGRGFNVKGQETIKAMGRDSKAGDIIENIIRDYERATIRAERNAVGKTFLDLVTTNPDPKLWEVQPLKRAPRMTDGQVRYQTVEDKGDDTISVKVAGEQVYVKINDPLLLRAMQNAFKGEKSDSERFIIRAAGAYTSLLRNTITRFNPVFGVINALRDSQMGAAGVFDSLGAEGLKLYAKHYPSAVAAGFRTEIGKSDPQRKQMDKWMEEMRFAGGTTGGVFMRDNKTIQSELRDAMMAAGASPKGVIDWAKHNKGTRAIKHVLHGLELIGATSEHAARLSAYAAAREMGKSPAEAASISKNLTVNFNRFGEQGQLINTLFLFYNASVQGSVRIAQMMKNPKVRYAMAGATAAGIGMALMAAAVGGDDEDGQPYWDKIPDFEKERNLIIMLPPGADQGEKVGTHGRYFKIPMAYGLNVFPVLGYQIADLIRYAKDPAKGVSPAKAGINMLSAVLGSYNPMGGSFDPTNPVQLGLAVAPTVADPFIQLAAGVDGFGKPTGPSKSPYDQRPDSETVSAQAHGSVHHRIARMLNEATGGNQVRSGAIDVQPGTIKNLGGILGGGLGRFISDSINLGYLGATDAPIEERDIPVVKQLYGEYDRKAGMSLYYERSKKALDEFKDAKEEFKAGIKRDRTDEDKFLYAMGGYAENIGKAMGELKKIEVQIAESNKTNGEKEIARREIQKAREKYAESFNKVWYEKESALKRK